jgi:hypothetical protein
MKKYEPTPEEKKKYLLPEERDFEILAKCNQLEKLELTKEDKFLVGFIMTQLEADWRKHLLEVLNKLIKKYK